jgi:type IV pilus assembly protein PilB
MPIHHHMEHVTTRHSPAPAGTRARLGQVLVDQNLVTPNDVADALEEQAATGERLGQILLSHEKIGASGLAVGLGSLFGMEVVDLTTVIPDSSAVSRLSEALARRLHALPIGWEDDRLVVALDNPANLSTLDDVRFAARTDVRFVVVRADQLRKAIDVAWQVGLTAPQSDRIAPDAPSPDLAHALEETPVVRFVNQLLARAVDERASDIHLEAVASGGRVRFRVDGILHDVLSAEPRLFLSAEARLKVMAGLDIAQRRLPQDGRLSMRIAGANIDVRVATLPTSRGESIVMRLLDTSHGLLDTADLGFFPDTLERFEAAYRRPGGALLVTGPTGSGKTTTLYAAVAKINGPDHNIVTVEDPIEYQIDGIKQVQVAERTGLSFDRALRAILRCDPDIILVGEIRDRETARIAAEAALTGHLVLSTLHTNDAASAPLRLVEMGLEPYLVASALNCVIGQRLARCLCPHCRESYSPTALDLKAAGWEQTGLRPPRTLYRPRGCADCSETGYKGRLAFHELMRITSEIRELILANAPAHALQAAAEDDGMRPLRVDGLMKAADGRTSIEELIRVMS